MPTTSQIIDKYSRKLESQIEISPIQRDYSREYLQFKKDMISKLTRYEKWAKALGNIIKISPSEKDGARIQEYLDTAHLEVTASQALTLSIISLLTIFFLTAIISIAIYFITNITPLMFIFLGLLAGVFVFYYTYTMPERLANSWRLQASAQMVPAILYIVVYMKHTSNLERAIAFASEHLEGPLALDFKKIFYDVEIAKFSTMKESLDNYLQKWRTTAPEFLESFHLIESSLFEPTESQRVKTLERSLQLILDGVYEKMLKYSREIRSPLFNTYMLGIVLPVLALALLPLASTLLQGLIQWYHTLLLFNIIIPFFVFYLISQILLKRPGGYGETALIENNPDYYQFISKKPWLIAAIVSIPFLLVGLLPFIFQLPFITNSLGLKSDYTLGELGFAFLEDIKLFDFKTIAGKTLGPFSPLSVLLSLFIPLSIAIFFSLSYYLKTRILIKAREGTKALEQEFSNSLFQLGNRLNDGIPAEIAFSKVAESSRGLRSEQFFSLVSRNIQQLGMSLERAIFDRKVGAIIYFPSQLIATSMHILIEAVKKGLEIAAQSLMSISEYSKNIEKINQRLHDLLAEVVSDMRSNITFLAPLLAGVVIGLASMITLILNKLYSIQINAPEGVFAEGFGSIASITKIFDVTQMIPPYFLQITIGTYIIQIIFILTIALVTISSGKDTLQEKYDISKFLRTGILLYIITSIVSILALTILAGVALSGMNY